MGSLSPIFFAALLYPLGGMSGLADERGIIWPVGPHYQIAAKAGATERFRCRSGRMVAISYRFTSAPSGRLTMELMEIDVDGSAINDRLLKSMNDILSLEQSVPQLLVQCSREGSRIAFVTSGSSEPAKYFELPTKLHQQ